MPDPTPAFEVAGVPASNVYQTLVSKGLSQSDASVLLSSWIYQNSTTTFQTFEYAITLAATDPSCASTFTRSFHHADWIDGESVVQAGQTTGELGFNARFHQLEADVDLLGSNVAKAFTCVASLRSSLVALLAEIRAEINRLRAEHNRWNTRFSSLAAIDKVANLGQLAAVQNFMGTTTLGDKLVSAWQTDHGLMLLPAVNTVGIEIVSDQRIQRPAMLASAIAENAKISTAFQGKTVAKADLLTQFGDIQVSGGHTIRELISILPDTSSYPTLDALVDDVSEREAAALRTTGGVGQAVSAALGIEAKVQAIDTAAVDQIKSIPPDVRAALSRQGLDTVGKLAGTTPVQLRLVLAKEGMTGVGPGEIASWTTTAKTLTKIKLA
jgi:hypothetical protein